MSSIAVVGAGFAGMSAAARLAKLGHDVIVFDSAAQAGGRLNGISIDGVVWQPSAMTVTLPGVFRDLFRKSGRVMTAALDIFPAEPRRHIFLGSRTPLTFALPTGTRSAQHDVMAEVFGRDPWSGWLDSFDNEWDIARRFIYEVLTTEDDIVALEGRLQLDKSAYRLAHKALKHRQLEALALDRWRLHGFDPKKVPGTWHMWHYVERNFGLWRFDGDMDGLAQALIKRLAERKVEIRTSTPVLGVHMKFGRVIGIQTEDEVWESDFVVWASGHRLPGLFDENPQRTTRVYTGIELDGYDLGQSLFVHGNHLMQVWDSGPQRWVAQTHKGTDVGRLLKKIGVPNESLVSIDRLPPLEREQQPAVISGSGLNLDLKSKSRGNSASFADLIARPAFSPAPGLYVVGGSAVADSSLELTGMGTAAVAQEIGAVPRQVSLG